MKQHGKRRLLYNKHRGRIWPVRLSLKGKSASSSAVHASNCPVLRDLEAECTIPLLMDRKLLHNKRQGRR